MFAYLESNDNATRTSTAHALTALLSKSVDASMVEVAVEEIGNKKAKAPLSKIISHVRLSLDALSYARAMPHMLKVLASLIQALQPRPSKSSSDIPPTGAELLILDLVQRAGNFRVKKGFEYKESVDEVLRAAMGVLGPEVILRVLPLGLLPEERLVFFYFLL